MTKQGDNGLVMRLTSFLHMTGKSTFTLPSFPYIAWHANGASQKDHPHLSLTTLHIIDYIHSGINTSFTTTKFMSILMQPHHLDHQK